MIAISQYSSPTVPNLGDPSYELATVSSHALTLGGYDAYASGEASAGCVPQQSPPIAVADAAGFPEVDVRGLAARRRRATSNVSFVSNADSDTSIDSSETPQRKRAVSDTPMRISARSKHRLSVEEQRKRTVFIEMTEDERREKNCQSARDCRLRKKRYIEVGQ